MNPVKDGYTATVQAIFFLDGNGDGEESPDKKR